MLIFIFFTALFLVACVAMGAFMKIAIAPGQLFDTLLSWQKMLDWLYGKGKFGQLFEKLLGGCNICFMHLITIINFVLYAFFMNVGLHNWVIGGNIFVNIIWYIVYVTIGWQLSTYYNVKEEKEN